MGDGSSQSASEYKGKARARNTDNDILSLDLLEQGSNAQGPYAQMQLVAQQDDYIQQRSTAIESVEATIAELGQIFQQLAHMVAEQRETVQRIDADTLDIASNVEGAQRELLKYFSSMGSNRWLMLKVFGVLIVFVSHFHCAHSNSRPVPIAHTCYVLCTCMPSQRSTSSIISLPLLHTRI